MSPSGLPALLDTALQRPGQVDLGADSKAVPLSTDVGVLAGLSTGWMPTPPTLLL